MYDVHLAIQYLLQNYRQWLAKILSITFLQGELGVTKNLEIVTLSVLQQHKRAPMVGAFYVFTQKRGWCSL